MTRALQARANSLFAALALAAAGLVAADAVAGDESMSGEDIIKRHIEKAGGTKAIQSVKSLHVNGTLSIPSFGIEGQVEFHYARPEQLLFTVSLPNFGEFRRGLTDGFGWSIDPQRGPVILEGEDLEAFRAQAQRAFSLLPSTKIYSEMKNEGPEQFDGRECHRVQVTLAATGDTSSEYYDAETGLFAGRVETLVGPAGEVESRLIAGEYQEFGELYMPTQWTTSAQGQSQVMTYNEITTNDVDHSVFEVPEAVQEIREPAEE